MRFFIDGDAFKLNDMFKCTYLHPKSNFSVEYHNIQQKAKTFFFFVELLLILCASKYSGPCFTIFQQLKLHFYCLSNTFKKTSAIDFCFSFGDETDNLYFRSKSIPNDLDS